MRLGVLDIGSNSAHLRVVDAQPGAPPLPVFRYRAPTRLAEATGADGAVDPPGVRRLVILLRRLSPLLTTDSLHQIQLIQAAADPDTTVLPRRRGAAQRSAGSR